MLFEDAVIIFFFSEYNSSQASPQTFFNSSLYSNVNKLFYNRIPKTGSTSMNSLIEAMKKRNKFDYILLPNEESFEHRFYTLDKVGTYMNVKFMLTAQTYPPLCCFNHWILS